MATISARVDDRLKASAEKVAEAIGIPLSTAINIFLKRFTAEKGFPFDVVAPKSELESSVWDPAEVEHTVKAAIADPDNTGLANHFTYFDPTTGKLKIHYN